MRGRAQNDETGSGGCAAATGSGRQGKSRSNSGLLVPLVPLTDTTVPKILVEEN